MPESFKDLYSSLTKNVFIERARQQLELGKDGLELARSYAEQGKPDFVLAYLLLIEQPDEEKREILAYAYEQRAKNSDEKAEQFKQQFRRPFPLIRLEAQKDRTAARAIREGQPVRTGNTKIGSSDE